MKITKERLKEIIKDVLREETGIRSFQKSGKIWKSIPQMSDDEKKAFFNKIDAAWKSKGKKES